jgi:putative thioredoxin
MLLNQGQTAPAQGDDLVTDTTAQTFIKDVIEESRTRPVLVDFWAPWCGPCKTLTPVLEKVVRAAKGKIKLVKMNIDEHPQVAQQLGIQSIPTVFAFVNGQPVDGFMGALPENQIAAFIERIGGKAEGGTADMIKAADELLAAGDAASAADLYARVLAEEPENVHALGSLARCHVTAGNPAAAKATLTLVPKGKENDPASRRRSPPIRRIIRRASIWRWRSMSAATATARSTSCSRSSGATANGTTTAPASNWFSCSTPGVRPTRQRSKAESGCRRCCSPDV